MARFTPLVERCELDHDQVILVCGASEYTRRWDEFCLARADKVIVAVGASVPEPQRAVAHAGQWTSLRGCDLLGYGVERGSESLAGWMAELAPVSTFAIRTDGHRRGDMARMARRLAGRAVGVVLSGGGARAFAHLGVIETAAERRRGDRPGRGREHGRFHRRPARLRDTTATRSTPAAMRSGYAATR